MEEIYKNTIKTSIRYKSAHIVVSSPSHAATRTKDFHDFSDDAIIGYFDAFDISNSPNSFTLYRQGYSHLSMSKEGTKSLPSVESRFAKVSIALQSFDYDSLFASQKWFYIENISAFIPKLASRDHDGNDAGDCLNNVVSAILDFVSAKKVSAFIISDSPLLDAVCLDTGFDVLNSLQMSDSGLRFTLLYFLFPSTKKQEN